MLKFEIGTELVIGGLYTGDYLVRVVAREENRVQVQEVEYPDSDPDWHEIEVDGERDAERFLNWEYRGIKSYVYPDNTPEKVYGAPCCRKVDSTGAVQVILKSSGSCRKVLTSFSTEAEAESFCREYGWEYEDDNGFLWDMDYQAATPADKGGEDEEPEQKRLCITYHMKRSNEGAETCITLPMMAEVAESILWDGTDSPYLIPACNGDVYRILACLSSIQGYEFDGFCMAEEVDLC